MENWEVFLNQFYYDPSHAGAFAGPQKVKQILQENNVDTNIKNIRTWLQNQDAYSLLRPVKYKFKRQRIVTSGIDDMWDADLAVVSNIAKHNNNFQYWLVVIDVFSRFLWIVPLLSKSSKDMMQGFQTLFEATTRRPLKLRTDNGMEFRNRAVKKLLQNEGINAYTTKNETKANYAERVIRTLKNMMYRYFLHHQTYKYTNILQALVKSYNTRPHASLNGLSPKQINKRNEAMVWKRMYVDTSKVVNKQKRYLLKVGDNVRISHLKFAFQRDYQEKWTKEVFKVTSRTRKQGINLYRLMDFLNEPISGHFYEEELQKVSKDVDSMYRIEKVLTRRRHKGVKQLFVKWVGWPKKFNSWVAETDVQNY